MLTSETFKASLARFDRWGTWLGIPCSLSLIAAPLAGMKVMFWSLFTLKLDTFPRSIIPFLLLVLVICALTLLLALPLKLFFIWLARSCGLLCPDCRHYLMDQGQSVLSNRTCPYCKSVILLD